MLRRNESLSFQSCYNIHRISYDPQRNLNYSPVIDFLSTDVVPQSYDIYQDLEDTCLVKKASETYNCYFKTRVLKRRITLQE